jgi:nitric oxide reductase subunit B
MAVFSLIPSDFYQLNFAVKYGLWFARSPEIASGPVIRALSWARLVPDVIFAAGAIVLFVFLFRTMWLTFLKKTENANVRGEYKGDTEPIRRS